CLKSLYKKRWTFVSQQRATWYAVVSLFYPLKLT
ncbi:MAG: hypothetical protein ACI89W_001139, partial [Gammaproteobacteria bacterium]